MKTIIKGAIAILIILGAVKTFQEHDVAAETKHYYQQFKDGEILQISKMLTLTHLKI